MMKPDPKRAARAITRPSPCSLDEADIEVMTSAAPLPKARRVTPASD